LPNAKTGRREDAERVAAIVPRPLAKAVIFAALGDKDRTFEALDRVVPLGPVRMEGRSHRSTICVAARRPAPERSAPEGRLAEIADSRRINTRKMSSPSERLPHHRLAMRRLGRRRVYSWGACEAPPGNSRRPGGNWPGFILGRMVPGNGACADNSASAESRCGARPARADQ